MHCGWINRGQDPFLQVQHFPLVSVLVQERILSAIMEHGWINRGRGPLLQMQHLPVVIVLMRERTSSLINQATYLAPLQPSPAQPSPDSVPLAAQGGTSSRLIQRPAAGGFPGSPAQ